MHTGPPSSAPGLLLKMWIFPILKIRLNLLEIIRIYQVTEVDHV